MSIKYKVIDHIIEVEGGYVNDPKDSGGETMYGITKEVARKYGWQYSMKSLPREFAFKIYSQIYWDILLLDSVEEISPRIAAEMIDTSVNQGSFRAAEYLQRALNVLNQEEKDYKDIVVDGVMGNNTLKAFKAYLNKRGAEGEIVLYNMLNCLQGAFYVNLAERRKKDERFIFGWFKNRVSVEQIK